MTNLTVPALLLLLSGCATMVRGRTQEVTISSTPPGATVVVDGVAIDTTPAVAAVSRTRSHTLRVERAGYAAESLTIVPSSAFGLLALNVGLLHPVAGAIGFGVDIAAGAHRRFVTDRLHFQLLRVDSAAVHVPYAHGAGRALLSAGARIRIVRLDFPVPTTTIGTLRDYGPDSLILESPPATIQRIPQRSIESIELSFGRDHGRSARRWAGRGTVTGLLLGLSVGVVMGDELAIVLLGGFGAMGGAAGGAVLGLTLGQDEKWLKVR